MKKKTNKSYLKYNLIFIFFMGLVFWGIYLHYDYIIRENNIKSQKKAEKLMENYIENKTLALKKNSERYSEFGLIDKREFDYLFIEKNSIWKVYNPLERKWDSIELDGLEKMYNSPNKGVINYEGKYYIYGGILKNAKAIFSVDEINQDFFAGFSKNTGINISNYGEGETYSLKDTGENINLGIYLKPDESNGLKGDIMVIYVLVLLVTIFTFSNFLRVKMKMVEERILDDISIIRESCGKSDIEINDRLDFHKVRLSLMKLGRSYYKKTAEVYSLKGKLTKTNLELRELAIIDKLTGLYNKRFLYETLENLKKESVVLPYHNIIMMIDLDNFKKLNDTNGHLEGDLLLHALGEILRDIGRGWGTAFRYGGDEFLIIFKKVKYEDFLDIVSEFELAKKNIMQRYVHVNLGVSAGVMLMDNLLGCDPDYLIKKVDDLLYEAKKNGKNQIVFKV